MAWLANPDWAVVLILAGILLVYAEFNRPGTVLLGCAGALAVMLGVWGLGHTAVSLAGSGLVLAGVALVVLGCRRWGSHLNRGGTAMEMEHPDVFFSIAGAACLAWGLGRLTEPALHMGIAVGVAVIFTAVTRELGRIALLAARKKQSAGPWDRDWGHPVAIRTDLKE